MRYRLIIDGMLAVHAKRAVFTALSGVPGVSHASVTMGEAEVDCADSVPEAILRRAISDVSCTVRSVTRLLPLA